MNWWTPTLALQVLAITFTSSFTSPATDTQVQGVVDVENSS
jgi:hypothetical protein